MSILWCGRLLGPGLGFVLGSVCLKYYVNPWEDVNSLTEGDFKFVGAWWLGLPIIAILVTITSPILMIFPERAAGTKDTDASDIAEQDHGKVSLKVSKWDTFKSFMVVFKRLLKVKIFILNIFSIVFFFFGFIGFSTFLPKYLEYHFRRKASTAGSLGGITKTMAGMIGNLVMGIVMTRFKIHARKLSAYNVLVGVLSIAVFISFIFLPCPSTLNSELLEPDFQCNQNCQCESVPVELLCIDDKELRFSSPCHLGCTSKNGKSFSGCACSNGTRVSEGSFSSCETSSCDTEFWTMLSLLFAKHLS